MTATAEFHEALRELALFARDPRFTPSINRLRYLISSHDAAEARADRAEATLQFVKADLASTGQAPWLLKYVEAALAAEKSDA
jgi:hypothetical protein